MATEEDKINDLDGRNLRAAAIFEAFSMEEMEQVLEANIFDLMGVSSELLQEQKDDLLKVFSETVQNRTVSRILEMLSDTDAEEFGKILEESPEKTDEFLIAKGVNKEQIAIVEMVLYKLELAKSKKEQGE